MTTRIEDLSLMADAAASLLEKLSLAGVTVPKKKQAVAELQRPSKTPLSIADIQDRGISRHAATRLHAAQIALHDRIWRQFVQTYNDIGRVSTNDQNLPVLARLICQKYLFACETSNQILIDGLRSPLASSTSSDILTQPRTQRDPRALGQWTSEARAILEAAWSQKQTVTPGEKKKLAYECNLTCRQVTVWFANQRQRRCKKESEAPITKSKSPRGRRDRDEPARRPRNKISWSSSDAAHDPPQEPREPSYEDHYAETLPTAVYHGSLPFVLPPEDILLPKVPPYLDIDMFLAPDHYDLILAEAAALQYPDEEHDAGQARTFGDEEHADAHAYDASNLLDLEWALVGVPHP